MSERDIPPAEEPDDGEEFYEDETTAVLHISAIDSGRHKAAAYLTVLGGTRLGEMMRIDDELTIGRGEDAGLRIVDPGVSRQHLVLTPLDGGVLLRDLQSSNGTFINNERVEEQLLQDGDKIQLGATAVLKFSYADRVEQTFQRRMYEAAVRDGLTGLYNRRHLLEQLEMEFAYVARHSSPLAIVMMDLDHFKAVNDTYGHVIGDAVLVSFAEFIQAQIRSEDLAARYGGEEFVLVCRGIRGPVGLIVAQRLLAGLSKLTVAAEQPDLRVTMSAGVAAVPDPRFTTPLALLEAADKALYQAKEGGRNQACLAK